MRLAPLLLVALLPSCLTWQLWESGSTPGDFGPEQLPASNGTLVVDAMPEHLRVLDPDMLGTLEFLSLGRESQFARALLAHPEIFDVQHVAFTGHLDPRHCDNSRGELVVAGKIQGDLRVIAPTRELMGQAARMQRAGGLLEHRSTWLLASTVMTPIKKPVERELPVHLQLSIQRRKPGTTSWPWRATQVLLTPAAMVADIVVTPALFIWFSFNPPRFIF